MVRKVRRPRVPRRRIPDGRLLASIRSDQPGRASGRISQRDTAFLAGISIDRYWRIEAGWSEATPDEKRSIAKVLGVRVSGVIWRLRTTERAAS